MFEAATAPAKGKNRWTESGAILPSLMGTTFLHCASMLKCDERHCELCA